MFPLFARTYLPPLACTHFTEPSYTHISLPACLFCRTSWDLELPPMPGVALTRLLPHVVVATFNIGGIFGLSPTVYTTLRCYPGSPLCYLLLTMPTVFHIPNIYLYSYSIVDLFIPLSTCWPAILHPTPTCLLLRTHFTCLATCCTLHAFARFFVLFLQQTAVYRLFCLYHHTRILLHACTHCPSLLPFGDMCGILLTFIFLLCVYYLA